MKTPALGDRVRRALPLLLLPFRYGVAVIACLTATAQNAQAQVTLSGNPSALIIGTAVAGAQPTPATDGSTFYSVTATAGQKITAYIDQTMPPGVTLEVSLAAPSGAVSVGTVVLTTVAQDLVHSIPAGTFSGLAISYALRATVAAGVVSSRSVTAYFAIVAGP